MLFEVGVDGGFYGGMEAGGAAALEHLEANHFVLHRILHFGKAKLDAGIVQTLFELH